MNQGQGSTTEWKQRGIQAALHVSLSLASKHPKYTYYHLDLHSGSGYNANARCIGSPLAFLAAAVQAGRENYRALFVDKDESAIEHLMQRTDVGGDKLCACFNCDNAQVLPVLEELILAKERNPQFAWGSIIVDPNGWYGDVPHDELAAFCAKFPRMDLVMNLNVRTYQLGLWHIRNKTSAKWMAKFWPSITQFPKLFSRKDWLIRDIVHSKGPGDRFVLLVGRNYPTGDHVRQGFHHMDSAKGRSITESIEGDDGASKTANLF